MMLRKAMSYPRYDDAMQQPAATVLCSKSRGMNQHLKALHTGQLLCQLALWQLDFLQHKSRVASPLTISSYCNQL